MTWLLTGSDESDETPVLLVVLVMPSKLSGIG